MPAAPTVRDLVTASLSEIGVVGAGQSAGYEEASHALNTLNRLVDEWAAERLAIFAIVRSTHNIGNSIGDYEIGSAASSTLTYASIQSDGFDTTWTGEPPGWDGATVSSGTITNETTITQGGGHSVKLNVTALGSATITRDFSVFSGKSSSLSVYMTDLAVGGSGAIVRVSCVETGHYLTSAGAWQAASADTLTSTDAGLTQHSVSFTMEDAVLVGSDTATLRVVFYADNFVTGPAYFDTFSLSQTLTNIITPTIQIPRPLYIEHVHLLDTNVSPTLETPLTPLGPDGWARIPQKDLTGTRPSAWHYAPSLPTVTFTRTPTFPYGILHLWPVPTGSGFQIAIYSATQINQFDALASTVRLPPAYERMIVKNLALELCPAYSRTPHPMLVMQAAKSMAAVKRQNIRPTDMGFEAAALMGNRGGYSIYQG